MDWARAVSLKMPTSQRTPTPYKNESKFDWFGDGNRVNSSNFIATILKFSEIFDHPFSHVFIVGNMFPVSHGPVTTSNNFGHKLVSGIYSLHNETMTLKKHATKYKNMWELLVEFLIKFQSDEIKIAPVNSIHITKSINLF